MSVEIKDGKVVQTNEMTVEQYVAIKTQQIDQLNVQLENLAKQKVQQNTQIDNQTADINARIASVQAEIDATKE